MPTSQLDRLQQALRPRGLRFVEGRRGALKLRAAGDQKTRMRPVVGRREREWLLLEQPAGQRRSCVEALRRQTGVVFAKYVALAPGGPISIRADLPLTPELLDAPDLLEALLAAAVTPGSAARGAGEGAGEILGLIRTALGERGHTEDTESGFELKVQPAAGQARVLLVKLSTETVRFSLRLARAAELATGDLEVVAAYCLCLNAEHYLGRIGLEDHRPVAELVLPIRDVTPHFCHMAVDAVLSFTTREQALGLLIGDARARGLYARHFGLATT